MILKMYSNSDIYRLDKERGKRMVYNIFNIEKWNADTYKTVSELKKYFLALKEQNIIFGSKIEKIMIMGIIFNDDRPYYTFKNWKWYAHCFDAGKKDEINYVEVEEGPLFNPNKTENVSLTLDEPLSLIFDKGGHLDIDFTRTARFMIKLNSFNFSEQSYTHNDSWLDVSKYFSKNIIGHKVVDINAATYSHNNENIDHVEFIMDNGYRLSLETDLMTGYMSLSEEGPIKTKEQNSERL